MPMTIRKAIEINQSLLDGEYDHRDADMEDALKLGIEALKRLKELSPYPHEYLGGPLPGETKE